MTIDKVDKIVREKVFETGDIVINLQRFNEIFGQLNIPREHVVNVGGVAAMLHACAVDSSNKHFFQWRGTHDLDFALTSIVGTNNINRVVENGGFKLKNSGPSRTVEDQWTLELSLGTAKGYFPDERILKVDIYTPVNNLGDIQINKRTIHPYPARFLTEPVQVLAVGKEKYTVPSITDCMILKIDVYPNFRDKDLADIHSLLYSAEKTGLAPKDIVAKLKGAYTVRGVVSSRWQTKIKPALAELWQPGNRPTVEFVPAASREYLGKVSEALKTV